MVEDEFKEGVNKLLNIKGQSSVFDYDSYDWGCLRYLLELWIFLCLTRFAKKKVRTATKWAGFNLMLYVLYGLGFVNILEDMKVEKRSNCVYTPLQISLAYIVKIKDKTALH